MTQTPAGWHPDPSNGGRLRYWDGQRWTEHFAPEQAPAGPPTVLQQQPVKKKGHAGRNVVLGAIGVVVLIAIFSSLAGGSDDSDDASPTADTSASAGASTPASKAPAKPRVPKYTVAQASAIRAAKQYLELGTGFSRAGLIEQLSSPAGSGFDRSLAVFAVDHSGAKWKEQAVIAAKNYMKLSGFSRAGLINQLTAQAGSKFTPAQANYAADQIGL